jgi:dephospho-CoA kinase
MTTLSKPIIVGLAGTHASGKDTLADYLVDKYNLFHVSTGDLVREEAMRKYGSIERPVLYKTANEIRNTRGHGALGHMAKELYDTVREKHPNGLVVSGFRAVAEAQAVKDEGGILLFVDAPERTRYERLVSRGRVEEGVLSFEEFKKREDDENGKVEQAFNILAIKDIADHVLINDGPLEEFITEAEKALGLSS